MRRNFDWEAIEATIKLGGLQELYRRDPDAWAEYVLVQDQKKQQEAERAAWRKRQEEQREAEAWAKIEPNQFEIWHAAGQMLWKGSMREQLFKPVRQAFEVLTECHANLERLLGSEPLRISDTQPTNPNARAECDQIRRHIKCGPGSTFETILHEIGHAVEYHLRPETVLRRHQKNLPGVVHVEACSIGKDMPIDSDHRFKELDEEFQRAQHQEAAPISQYALTNGAEWFGEAFMFFYAHPMHLRETGPGSYRVLDRLTT
jgi:hypothetical protein